MTDNCPNRLKINEYIYVESRNLFYFCIVAGLTSALTKSVSLRQNTYGMHSNLYLMSSTSQSPTSVTDVSSQIHRPAVGTVTAATTLSTVSKVHDHGDQGQSHYTKNVSTLVNYRKIQFNNKFNLATSLPASTIAPLTAGAAMISVLPTPAAVVAASSIGQDKSDDNLDHNSLVEYKEPMYFGTENSTTITTQVGANAHLPCIIHHIGEGVVSIKYVGRYLYFF